MFVLFIPLQLSDDFDDYDSLLHDKTLLVPRRNLQVTWQQGLYEALQVCWSPADIGEEVGYTLDKSPVHHWTDAFSLQVTLE